MSDLTDSSHLVVNSRLRIPRSEIELSYVRSSGPGGQNVNKVNSRAVLRWPIIASPSLPDDVRQRFLRHYRRRVTSSGDLVISSQRWRDAGRNAADCLEKLQALLATVSTPPTPRRPTRPTRASRRRRLQDKHRQGEKKRDRRTGLGDES